MFLRPCFYMLTLMILTACNDNDWVPKPMIGVTMKCFEEKAPVHWSYCVNQTSNYDSQTILYHFHGRNGAATWWNDDTYYSAEIQRHWRQTGVTPPLVVSISFGKLWLLVDWEAANAPNLYHIFLDTAMQTVEQRLGMPIKERMLVGESMGGFNALLIGLKDKSRFLKVAALCPPLPTVSPFASWHDKISYVTASSTSWKRATTLLFFAHIFFPDKQTWIDNNPVDLATTYDFSSGPSLYLSCGTKDSWGCMEGSLSIVKSLQANGGAIEWVPRPGGHCDVDSISVAEFLRPSEKRKLRSAKIESNERIDRPFR